MTHGSVFTISLVRKGDNITTVDSEEQTITLAARPAALPAQ